MQLVEVGSKESPNYNSVSPEPKSQIMDNYKIKLEKLDCSCIITFLKFQVKEFAINSEEARKYNEEHFLKKIPIMQRFVITFTKPYKDSFSSLGVSGILIMVEDYYEGR